MAKDPVCGRKVNEGHPGGKSEYQDRLYFFCSVACKRQFEQHPQRYSRSHAAERLSFMVRVLKEQRVDPAGRLEPMEVFHFLDHLTAQDLEELLQGLQDRECYAAVSRLLGVPEQAVERRLAETQARVNRLLEEHPARVAPTKGG